MQDTLLTKLLDGQDKINEKLTVISERIVRVEDTVKRHDEYNFPKMEVSIEEIRVNAKRDAKIVEDLCRVVSRSDGRMSTMEDDIKASSAANKVFRDIATVGKIGKVIIVSLLSILFSVIAIKNIVSGNITEGLSKLKDLLL